MLAAWRPVLLRRYHHPVHADTHETLPTNNQLIVLVKSGETNIGSFHSGRWTRANHWPGNLGYIAANETARLQWSGTRRHTTLQLHLPQSLLFEAADDLNVRLSSVEDRLNALTSRDSTIQQTILALEKASGQNAPELYAESAAHFLAVHLLSFRRSASLASETGATALLRRIDEFLHAHFEKDVGLEDIAASVGLGTFQLIRVMKENCGETPFRRLTRIRIEHAKELLASGSISSADVAAHCGYSSASHLAIAFRRVSGESPRQYLDRLRGLREEL